MGTGEKEDNALYDVVVNHEGRYSLWSVHRGDPPRGWKKAGKRGPREECLAYIKEVWTDMRPLGVRERLEEPVRGRSRSGAVEAGAAAGPGRRRRGRTAQVGLEGQAEAKPADPRDDLVSFLSAGDHPVEVSLRPERNVGLFKNAIDRGYVHVKFTDTRGGTELGVRLDSEACDPTRADFETGVGDVHIEGALTLNYVKVRCVADISLDTLSGRGRLERVE